MQGDPASVDLRVLHVFNRPGVSPVFCERVY